MVLHPPSSSRTHQRRAPQASWLAADPRRRLLRAEERLSLAMAAEGLPALEDRLRLVQEVAHRRHLGAPERRTARTLARAASTSPREWRAGSVTCWWTPRAWCSKRGSTAPGCPTKTASGCCWGRCALASRAFLTCGSTPATREGAGVGQRRLWTLAWRWCASPKGSPREGARAVG